MARFVRTYSMIGKSSCEQGRVSSRDVDHGCLSVLTTGTDSVVSLGGAGLIAMETFTLWAIPYLVRNCIRHVLE